MRITAAVTSLIILFPVFHVLGIDPLLYKDETSYESGIPSVPVEFRKFRRQISGDKALTPSQKVRRRQACMYKTNCYKRERKSNARSANRKSAKSANKNRDRRNKQLRSGFGSQRRGKQNFGPKFQTKSLSPVRQARHQHHFRTLDSVSGNVYSDAYRADKRLDNDNQNPQFFNVMQTFFHNQDVYSKKSHFGKSRGSKGSWLSGGFDIDSTMELVSTKSLSGTYQDYDDEYQKSLSSVYQDYHNPLRHSLVNLLTELFVTLNNTTVKNDYEVVSGLADENVEISESANDFCQRWIDHKDKLEAVFLGSSTRLPSCPCFYPSNIFYNDKIWDKRQQKNFRWRDASGKSQRMDIYKPGAFYCVRSLLTQGSGSAAAQHCCYDQERRLITRGSGAGTPNFVSPEASQLLHEKIDLLPWQLCKGDFSRFNSMRPPNNDNDCQPNPDEEEYQRQKAEKKSF